MPSPESVSIINQLWTRRNVRWAAALMLIGPLLNLANLVANSSWTCQFLLPADVADMLLDLTLAIAFFAFSFSAIFARHWQRIAWLCCVLSVIDGVFGAVYGVFGAFDTDGMIFCTSIILFMSGTGALIPWSVRRQAGFSFICVAGFALVWSGRRVYGGAMSIEWPVILIAVAFAQAATAMRERYARAREQSERMVRDSEQKLRKIFDLNHDSIGIIRLSDQRFIDANPALESMGYSHAEIVGATGTELGFWIDDESRERYYARLAADGQIKNTEIGFRSRSGQIVPYLCSGVIADLQGESCLIFVSRDITQLKAAERELIDAREQALAASRAKSEALSSMSHEIRTPLNAILGMAELMLDSNLDDQQIRYMNTMHDNGNILLALINDVLDLARVESGRIILERIAFDLGALVERVIETLRVQTDKKNLTLSARIEPGVPPILIGDPLRLRQILVNLIGNATKFTFEGGVMLSVAPENGSAPAGMLHFAVSDTGIGIAPPDLERIFTSFSQAETSTARRFGGSGLGLSISKQLVNLMGGEIRVESEPDHGSAFHFTAQFDIPDQALAPALIPALSDREFTPLHRASHPPAPLRPLEILVADDAADNRMLIGAFLKNTPYRLDQVENGALALEHFIANRYDLVLIDEQMPVMDGQTATRAIRQWELDHGRAPTPIVALTAGATPDSIAISRAAGCTEHVVKPFRRAALLEMIARVTA